MSRVKINYALDVVIGLAFLLSGVTGLAFLAMGSGGYQGGRNLEFATSFLGIARTAWSDLHTLTSIVMIVGVAAHLVFHFKWIVCMTQRVFRRSQRATRVEACELTV
jgi:uncharacterized protein DUF4405